MAKQKMSGGFSVVQGTLLTGKFNQELAQLGDGDYKYYIENVKKNSFLPYSNYLFSVILPFLSEALPDHPDKTALYKYFEDTYAPLHKTTINGEEFEWVDLKTEKAIYVQDFIEKILKHAKKFWNIEVPETGEFSKAEQFEAKAQAAIGAQVDWARFISQQNSNKLNEDEHNRHHKD